MFNNSPIVHKLAAQLDNERPPKGPEPRRQLTPDPCLPSSLPRTAFLLREGELNAPKEILRQLRRSPPPSPTLDTHFDEDADEHEPPVTPPKRARTNSEASTRSFTSILSSPKSMKKAGGNAPWKEPQPYEIFRAVERKDVMFLMEVRDRAFHLLLRKTGDATPLVHAMRIGDSHREVAIILLGAFSKWVNNLTDLEMSPSSSANKQTRVLLKALRANLKVAIDYGLQRSQSDLIASFLQTLVMSEGEKWVRDQAGDVGIALRSGTEGRPVATAEAAVRGFATRELGKAEAIASLEDYIANATADLVIMGAWSCVQDVIDVETIPTWYFARDDRVYNAFVGFLARYKSDIARKASKRLKWQLRVLEKALQGRNIMYRSKVALLAGELDEGEGV